METKCFIYDWTVGIFANLCFPPTNFSKSTTNIIAAIIRVYNKNKSAKRKLSIKTDLYSLHPTLPTFSILI